MKRIVCAAFMMMVCTAILAIPNRPPTASFTASPGSGIVGTTFTVDASATSDDRTRIGLLVSRSQDGGLTFSSQSFAMDTSTPFQMPDGTTRTPGACTTARLLYDRPIMGVDKSGASPYSGYVYIVADAYHFDADCGGFYTVFIRSTDHGATWNAGRAFGYHQAPVGLGIAPNGTLYIAGTPTDGSPCAGGAGVVVRKSVDGGASFQPPTCVLPLSPNFQPFSAWTAAAPSDSNKVYIGFTNFDVSPSSSAHVHVTRSTNAGASWSPQVRVDDVLPDDGVSHYFITVSASSTGRIDAAWFDYRNGPIKYSPSSFSPGDVYYSFSLDGGATWAPNLRLSSVTGALFFGGGNDFLTVVSSGAQARVVYAQDTNGNGLYETYLTTVNFH